MKKKHRPTRQILQPRQKQQETAMTDTAGQRGSGNVFADLGFENAEQLQRRSYLAIEILLILKHQNMSLPAFADWLGEDLAVVDKTLRVPFVGTDEAVLQGWRECLMAEVGKAGLESLLERAREGKTSRLPRNPRPKGQRGSVHLILLMIFMIGLGIWIIWSDTRVVAEQPLGILGSGENELRINGKVLETPQTYYPLRDPVALDKGTPLVLLTMFSGKRVICDERRLVCVGTSRLDKHIGKAGGVQ